MPFFLYIYSSSEIWVKEFENEWFESLGEQEKKRKK
jgi:hypothetical protein